MKLRIIHGALFFLALVLPMYLVRFTIGVPTTVLEVVTWVVFVGILLSAPDRIKKALMDRDHLITIGILLILLGGVVGLRVSHHAVQSAGLFKGYLITPLVAGLLVVLGGKKGRKMVEWGAICAGFIVSLTSLGQWVLHTGLPDGRIVGVYALDTGASPNYLALFVAPVAILAYGMALSASRTRMQRTIAIIFALSMSASVVLSQSRAGIAVILFALVWFVWMTLRARAGLQKRVDVLFTGIAIICIAIAVVMGIPRLLANPHSGRISSSNNIRYEIWKTTIQKIIPVYPITGVGFGEFQTVFTQMTRTQVNYPEYIAPWALTPHNIILALWVDTGLVGVIGFLIVCVGVCRRIPRSSIWFAVFVSILLFGVVDTPILKNDLGAFFWMIVGGSTVWFAKKETV